MSSSAKVKFLFHEYTFPPTQKEKRIAYSVEYLEEKKHEFTTFLGGLSPLQLNFLNYVVFLCNTFGRRNTASQTKIAREAGSRQGGGREWVSRTLNQAKQMDLIDFRQTGDKKPNTYWLHDILHIPEVRLYFSKWLPALKWLPEKAGTMLNASKVFPDKAKELINAAYNFAGQAIEAFLMQIKRRRALNQSKVTLSNTNTLIYEKIPETICKESLNVGVETLSSCARDSRETLHRQKTLKLANEAETLGDLLKSLGIPSDLFS